MTDKLAYARKESAWYMDRILELFKPGKKITILVRDPTDNEADFMMTNDQIPDLVAMLERSKKREETPADPL